jgi:hypothetical protein
MILPHVGIRPAVSETAFRHQGLVVFQVQLVKQHDALSMTRDYTAFTEQRLLEQGKAAAARDLGFPSGCSLSSPARRCRCRAGSASADPEARHLGEQGWGDRSSAGPRQIYNNRTDAIFACRVKR